MPPDKAELKTRQFVLLYLFAIPTFALKFPPNLQSTADSDELYDSLNLSPLIDY